MNPDSLTPEHLLVPSMLFILFLDFINFYPIPLSLQTARIVLIASSEEFAIFPPLSPERLRIHYILTWSHSHYCIPPPTRLGFAKTSALFPESSQLAVSTSSVFQWLLPAGLTESQKSLSHIFCPDLILFAAPPAAPSTGASMQWELSGFLLNQ